MKSPLLHPNHPPPVTLTSTLPLPPPPQVMEVVEDSVKFADESPKPERGQLLENVFPDPRGFGIAEDGL